jgi:hypothetical protein
MIDLAVVRCLGMPRTCLTHGSSFATDALSERVQTCKREESKWAGVLPAAPFGTKLRQLEP